MKNHRTAALNTVDLVLQRNRLLSAEDFAMQTGIVGQAVRELEGPDAMTHWRSLADVANLAETLAGMGLGAGPEADRVIAEAQTALGAVFERRQQTGTWQVDDQQGESFEWLAALHKTQLRDCTYGEFETAYRRTAERLRQAIKGNAPRRAVVVTGQIGGAL